MKHLTVRTISEAKLFYKQREGKDAISNLVTTKGKAAAKTPRSKRRRAVALQTAEKPKSRKPAQPGETQAETETRQDMFDLARDRRARAEAWDKKTSGPTPYPSTSKAPGTERGVPTTRRRRQAANMLRAATGKPLLKVDSITPLTLPMIAESNRARRKDTKDKKKAILKKLHAQGDTETVDSSNPENLKFKQKKPEEAGVYAKELRDKRAREAEREAERRWDSSYFRQQEDGFNDRYYK